MRSEELEVRILRYDIFRVQASTRPLCVLCSLSYYVHYIYCIYHSHEDKMKIPIPSEKGHIRSEKETGIIRRLYDWVLHWAHTPYGMPALFFLSLAESSFFPIPPDVLLIALAVSVPARSFRFALVCATGSVIGGTLGYLIGMNLWYAADGAYSAFANLFFTYIPGFSYEGFDKVKEMYNSNAFLAVFTAGFTPIPYKIFTIAGGVCKINFSIFIIINLLSNTLLEIN